VTPSAIGTAAAEGAPVTDLLTAVRAITYLSLPAASVHTNGAVRRVRGVVFPRAHRRHHAGSPGGERGQEHDDGPVRLHVSADCLRGGGGHRIGARGADRVEPVGEDGVTETVADQLFGRGDADVDGPFLGVDVGEPGFAGR